jgi:hypothetical protein
MKTMYCKKCGERPVTNLARLLCSRCYSTVRNRLLRLGLPIRTTPLQKKRAMIIRLRQNYGVQLLKDINLVDSKHFWNLTSVADKYGVSRELVRQWYTKIKGRPYQKTKSKKVAKRKVGYGCAHDPRHKIAEYQKGGGVFAGATAELMFFNECKKRGFDISFCCNGSVDFKVNTLLVDVKFCSKPKFFNVSNDTSYYKFVARGKQVEIAHFFACYHVSEKEFFIIPSGKTSKKNGIIAIYISKQQTNYRSSKNRYWEYKGAWHLLEYRSVADLR